VVQKKAKGGGGEVGQRAEGGEKRCSSAFLSAFVFNREPDARFTRITFFNHVFLSRFFITFFNHVFRSRFF
jgi:hypothetical protein